MADNQEKEEPAARGNDWEVVSLTASTYAAAPRPSSEQVDMTDDENGNSIAQDEGETSRVMFMSGHFVFPPSQHENLPLEPEHNEIRGAQESDDTGSQLPVEGGIQSDMKEQEVVNTKSDMKEQEVVNTKGLTMPDEFQGIQIFDEKGNIFSVDGTEFEQGTAFQGLNLGDEKQSLYNTQKFSSFHSEPTIGGSANVDEDTAVTEAMEPYDQGFDSGLPKPTDKDYDKSDLPCGAWWKRQAASFYAHAKEANTFWSICIAAAVMGLVVLGQQWQQERWKVMQHKWQFSISDEISLVKGGIRNKSVPVDPPVVWRGISARNLKAEFIMYTTKSWKILLKDQCVLAFYFAVGLLSKHFIKILMIHEK